MQNFCLKILDFGSSHSSSAPIGASGEKLRPAKTSSKLRNARAPTFRSYTVTYSATKHIVGGAVKKAFFSFKIEIYSNKCNLKCRKMVKCNKFSPTAPIGTTPFYLGYVQCCLQKDFRPTNAFDNYRSSADASDFLDARRINLP